MSRQREKRGAHTIDNAQQTADGDDTATDDDRRRENRVAHGKRHTSGNRRARPDDTNDTDNTDDTEAAAMDAAQITQLLAKLARGADCKPLPQMPGVPSFDGTKVTAFVEKHECLARSTNCDVTVSAVIGHFPYYCTEDVPKTVLMLPAHAYCDSESRSWPALRAEMLGAFRALDNAAFKYTRGNLERLCSALQDHESDRDYLFELKSFLLSFHHISEEITASGMMCEYERTMLLVRTLPARMRTKAAGQLRLDPLQPSTFRYAALHS